MGDGDPMSIPPDIVEDLGWPGEGPFRVDDPLGFACWDQMAQEGRRLMQVVVWALSAFEPVPSNKFPGYGAPGSSRFQHTESDGCPAHVVKAPRSGGNVLAHARTRAEEVPEFVVTAAISSG